MIGVTRASLQALGMLRSIDWSSFFADNIDFAEYLGAEMSHEFIYSLHSKAQYLLCVRLCLTLFS